MAGVLIPVLQNEFNLPDGSFGRGQMQYELRMSVGRLFVPGIKCTYELLRCKLINASIVSRAEIKVVE